MQKEIIIHNMKKSYDLPEVVDKDPTEIKSIIEQIKGSSLPDDVKKFVIKCVELALWLPIFLQSKAISIHRLRTMIFGKGYNKQNISTTSSTDPVEPNNKTEPPESTINQTSPDVVNPDKTVNHVQQHNTVITDITMTDATSHGLSPDLTTPNKKPGHGRHPHTVYTNAIEITFSRYLIQLNGT